MQRLVWSLAGHADFALKVLFGSPNLQIFSVKFNFEDASDNDVPYLLLST